MTTYTPPAHDLDAGFEEITEALATIRQTEDGSHWDAGDLSAAWLSRFKHGDRMAEIYRLADSSGYTYAGLRERIDCSNYWPKNVRNQFEDLAWSYWNRARRGVELPEAITRLEHVLANPMGVDEFASWCSDKLEPSNKSEPTLQEALLAVASSLTDLSARKDLPEMIVPFVHKAVRVMSEALGLLEKAKATK